jgi:hypothetical protein
MTLSLKEVDAIPDRFLLNRWPGGGFDLCLAHCPGCCSSSSLNSWLLDPVIRIKLYRQVLIPPPRGVD